VGALLALHQAGLKVPQDVSLVGFDDLASSMYTSPPLTTIHQPAYELGRLAASAMLQLLSGGRPDVSVPAPRLVLRASSGPLAD
jgi:LacI family transcriptional regulator